MFSLKYQIIQNKEIIEQTLIANKKYVLITINDNRILFSCDEQSCYKVNGSFKTLQKIERTGNDNVVKSIKSQIGEIFHREKDNYHLDKLLVEYHSRTLELENSCAKMRLTGTLTLISPPELENTCISDYLNYDKKHLPFEFPRKNDEVIANLDFEISNPLGSQKQSVKLKAIEPIDFESEFEILASYKRLN